MRLDGRPLALRNPSEALAAGIVLLTNDRLREGVLPDFTIQENVVLPILDRFAGLLGLLDMGAMETAAREAIARLRVCAGAAAPVRSLSGGNQQKVLFAKWLGTRPRVFIMDEPTIGIDVGSKAEIREMIRSDRGRRRRRRADHGRDRRADDLVRPGAGHVQGQVRGRADGCRDRKEHDLARLGQREDGGLSVAVTGRSGGGRPREILRQSYGLIQALAVLLVLVVVMATLSPRFLSWNNIANLMGEMAVPLIVAAGMTIVMISGEFDISVGSVVALSAAVSATVMLQYGVVAGVAVSLLIGPASGWLNGMVTTKGRIPSFIVTLGTMMMARSLAFVVTGGKVVSDLPEGFKALGQRASRASRCCSCSRCSPTPSAGSC